MPDGTELPRGCGLDNPVAVPTGILLAPIPSDGFRHSRQPRPVFYQFFDIYRGEIFNTVRHWISQRLEQTSRNQDWNVVRLAV